MTTEPVGGKRLATADRSLLKKLANGHAIRGTRIFPFPTHYIMLGKEPTRIDENDVARLAQRGWIDVDGEKFGDVWTYSITQKGRDVLATSVVEEPLDQGKLL